MRCALALRVSAIAASLAVSGLGGCLGRVDPHTFGNFASRLELVSDVSSLGSGADGLLARVAASGNIVAVFSVEYESFLQRSATGTYSVAVLRRTDRNVSRSTPFFVDNVAYFTNRTPGTELAAGFSMTGDTVGSVVATVQSGSATLPTGMGCGSQDGFAFLIKEPSEVWVYAADRVSRTAAIPLAASDSYYAINYLPNGLLLAVGDNIVTVIDPLAQRTKTISLGRETPLPLTRNVPAFGAVLAYADDSAFVVDGGKTIYNVRATSADDVEVLLRQEKATNARSLAFDRIKKHLVVANGIGGTLLFEADVPEDLIYLNRATAPNITGQVSYNVSDDSFALATNPVSAVFKIFTP